MIIRRMTKNDFPEISLRLDGIAGEYYCQHRPEWLQMLCGLKDETNYSLVAEDDGIVAYFPLSKFSGSRGALLQSLPYPAGYGGIICLKENTDLQILYKKMNTFLVEKIYKEKDLQTFSMCLSPVDKNAEMYKQVFEFDFCAEKHTQYIDLNEDPLANLNSKQRNNFRRNLKKAKQLDLQIEFGNTKQFFENFYRLTLDEFQKKGYVQPDQFYYQAIQEDIVQMGFGIYAQMTVNGKIAGTALLTFGEKVADLFLRAVSDEFKKEQAGLYFDTQIFDYLKKRGFSTINLQSSPQYEDAIFLYKKGLGGKESRFYYLSKKLPGYTQFGNATLAEIKTDYQNHYTLPFREIL